MATAHTIVLTAVVATLACLAHAQNNQYSTTPVPILKQINRHNDDGSYSYGYEGADGSFKIETKQANGEVFGKYGYVDDTGKVREVEYGASKRGFEVSGTGINVPPPTLASNNNPANAYVSDDYDDGQYREDPSIYYKADNTNYQAPKQHRFNNQRSQLQNYPQQQQQYRAPQQQYNAPQQQYNAPQQQYNAPQQYNNQQYNNYNPPQQRSYNAPSVNNADLFRGHPATNFDVKTGSYSINYSG